MNRSFIEVPMFAAKWRELGLTDEKDDLSEDEKKAFRVVIKFLKEE